MVDQVSEPPPPQQTVDGRCTECGRRWTVAELPMPLERAAELMMEAKCPRGCKAPIRIAQMV